MPPGIGPYTGNYASLSIGAFETTTSLYMLRVWDRALTADEMWGAFQTAP